MRHLSNIRGALPSGSLIFHYVMIALLLIALGGGVVYCSHVKKAMETVDWNARQVEGLVNKLKVDLPDTPEVNAKLTRIQLQSGQIQSTVQSVVPNSTAIN